MGLFNFVGSSTASRADIPETARGRGDEAVAASTLLSSAYYCVLALAMLASPHAFVDRILRNICGNLWRISQNITLTFCFTLDYFK